MKVGHYGIDPRKKADPLILNKSYNSTNGGGMYSHKTYGNRSYERITKSVISTKAQKSDVLGPLSSPTQRLNEVFDNLILQIHDKPLHEAMENTLTDLFAESSIAMWYHVGANQQLYSPSKSRYTTFKNSIVGYVYNNPKVLNLSDPSKHEQYDLGIDEGQTPSLYVPLLDINDKVELILQMTSHKRRFESVDVELAELFSKKFQLFSHLLIQRTEEIPLKILKGGTTYQIMKGLLNKFEAHFRCRVVELWANDGLNTMFLKYDVPSGKFISCGSINPGVVEQPLKNGISLNLPNVKQCSEYNPLFDGEEDEAIMVEPFIADNQTNCLIVRGKQGGMFNILEQNQLRMFTPLISRSIIFSTHNNNNNNSSQMDGGEEPLQFDGDFAEKLKALLEVAEIISGVLDIDSLIPIIMERSCSLVDAERCSLFLVDKAKQELVSRFHGGLSKSIRLPINRGIVGHSATTGKIVKINDAYSDPRFDKNIDLITGFRTRALLTVPIYNNRGEIVGVTEMINKLDDSYFSDDDIKMMMAFNVFCGISLDNARLYQTSLELTRQLRSFVEMSSAINEAKTVHDVMEEILQNAKSVIGASRATIYLFDDDTSQLNSFISIGEPNQHGTIFAEDILMYKKPKAFSREEIFYKLQTNFDMSLDGMPLGRGSTNSSATSSQSLVHLSCLIDSESNLSQTNTATVENICGLPLIANDRFSGVMELTCSGRILPEDIKLLDCFAVFASVSLERSELQAIARLGHVEVNLKSIIPLEERRLTEIPQKLRIKPENMKTIFTIAFDAVAWDGLGHFKVLWAIVDSFGLFAEFKIVNEKFFRFLTEISETYKKVPYHNWRHAVDVTQFCTYELKLTEFDQVLTKFELLGFIVAAICHDANHDGFTNVYNEKAETPLGILFKNQSVMETHHCTVAIDVISKEECNIFSELPPPDFKNMWSLIIALILITDMAKHFNFLKEVNSKVDEGGMDLQNPEDRLMSMQVLLKCGDISNVSRPFELADKWCDVLCEEFFRQGDLEMANGMEYTSPLNDRAHLDKPKSQIGFYTFVCLPLYETGARVFSKLQANVDQVKSNLAVWKEATEKRAKEEAEREAAEKEAAEKAEAEKKAE